MVLGDFCHWKRLKWILLWAVLIFLIVTYMSSYWSLHVVQDVKDGKANYKLKAKIHVGSGKGLESTNNKDIEGTAFGKIVEGPESYPVKETPKDHRLEMAFPDLTVEELRVLQGNDGKSDDDRLSKTSPSPLSRGVTSQKYHSSTSVTKKPNSSTSSPFIKSKNLTLEEGKAINGRTTAGSSIVSNKRSGALISPDDVPFVRTEGADCAALIRNEKEAQAKAKKYQDHYPKNTMDDKAIYQLAQNCETFVNKRQYILSPVSKEEEMFPIAYSILIFKEMDVVERLLRLIYRPQNYYCIHVDAKAKQEFRDAAAAVAKCFPNVFLTSRSVDVQWGWFSVLEPELICMEELWKYPKWKYFINLTGQEMPLKTNLDIVRILKAFNGANSLEGTVKRRNVERTEFIHDGYWGTKKKKEPCPVNVTLAKGSLHISVQRGFVDHILHDPNVLEFRKWVMDTGVPDETFFSSLNVSPQLGIPGAFTGTPETNKDTNPFITRFKNWGTWPFDWPCKGQRVRMVCIFSVGDLPALANRPELFANKFYRDYQPLASSCMEELIFNRTREEIMGDRIFNAEYYKQLDFVQHHIGEEPKVE